MADPTKEPAFSHPDWPWWTITQSIIWMVGEKRSFVGLLGDEDTAIRKRKTEAADKLRAALANGRLIAFGITSENRKPEPIDTIDWATRKIYLVDWWMTDPYAGYIVKRADVQKLWPRDVTPRASRSGRGRRKGVGSLEVRDAPLIDEMHRLITSGVAGSPYAAATLLLDQATGAGSDDSKRKRLVDRYRGRFSQD